MEKRFVLVCQNVDCKVRNGSDLMERLQSEFSDDFSLEVRPYMCFGACHDGPNVVVYPDKVWCAGVTPDHIPAVVEYIRNGTPVPQLDKIHQDLKEMIFQLLDAGLY